MLVCGFFFSLFSCRVSFPFFFNFFSFFYFVLTSSIFFSYLFFYSNYQSSPPFYLHTSLPIQCFPSLSQMDFEALPPFSTASFSEIKPVCYRTPNTPSSSCWFKSQLLLSIMSRFMLKSFLNLRFKSFAEQKKYLFLSLFFVFIIILDCHLKVSSRSS